MKRLFWVFLVGFWSLMCLGARYSFASQVDILLQKLVDKNILTPGEASQIRTETEEEAKVDAAKGKTPGLPDWIRNIKLKGDFRLRYQYKHDKAGNNVASDTSVGRVRVRLGLEGKVNDKLMAGIGIATNSGGDPRSTNITFGDKNGGYSSKMDVRLDYAYAKYLPFSWLTVEGGKMPLGDVLWEPTDLVWDTDITPEGGVFGIEKAVGSRATMFLKTGPLFGTADTSSNSDPVMLYLVQPGASYKFNDRVSIKGTFTLYDWTNVAGTAFPTDSWYKSSNTKNGSAWAYNYRVVSPAFEATIKEPFKAVGLNVESLKLFAEYVNNTVVSDKNTGYAVGFQLGHAKVEKWGDWQFKYIYAMLEKDAVLDTTPDSDRYSGKTGMRSHEGALTFGLAKNTFIGVDIYRSWNINGTSRKAPETLVQVDWNLKF